MKHHIKRGEIYNVELGSGIGSEQNGFRPGVIIQNNVGNRHSPTVIIAPVSSSVKKTHLPTHVLLPARYGLSETSIILLEQIRTIDKQRLSNFLGHLDNAHIQSLNHALKISIGLNDVPMSKKKFLLSRFQLHCATDALMRTGKLPPIPSSEPIPPNLLKHPVCSAAYKGNMIICPLQKRGGRFNYG